MRTVAAGSSIPCPRNVLISENLDCNSGSMIELSQIRNVAFLPSGMGSIITGAVLRLVTDTSAGKDHKNALRAETLADRERYRCGMIIRLLLPSINEDSLASLNN